MNLDALLTYQKADLAYKKLNDEIKKNQNYVEMRSNKKKFEAAKNAVLESEKQAENIVSSYEQGLKFIEQCAGEIEDLCAKLENGDADEETERLLVVRLEELQASVNEWKKRVDGLKALAEKAIGDYKAAQVSGKKSRADYADAKAKFEAFQKGKEAELKKLKDARDALAGAVEPAFIPLSRPQPNSTRICRAAFAEWSFRPRRKPTSKTKVIAGAKPAAESYINYKGLAKRG